jgi:dipeptidyl aminopeptidase/acylaminoacyl peptidase
MMFSGKLRLLIAISIAPILLLGAVLILIAVFYKPPQHAVLWYWHDGKMYAYDTDSQKTEEVNLPATGEIIAAKLSADGELLAYTDDDGLKVSAAPFNDPQLLIPAQTIGEPPMMRKLVNVPRNWSPDGQWLISAVSNVDISTLHITEISIHNTRPLNVGCLPGVSWAPDSQQFTYAKLQNSMCESESGLFIVNAKNLESERIYYDAEEQFDMGVSDANWSPSGHRIVFVNPDIASGNNTIDVIDPVSHNTARLTTPEPIRYSDPVWHSNSQVLYYISSSKDKNDQLIALDLNTNDMTELMTANNFLLAAPLSPDDKWLAIYQFESGNNSTDNQDEYGILDLSTHKYFQIVSLVENSSAGIAGWQMVP